MVIEDDPNDQVLIERAFRRIGVRDPIQIVGDGIEAITYLMGEGKYSDREKYAFPTFIMTDLKMPRGDGFAVLEFLKGNPQWKVVPTIVLTASDDRDDIKKSYMLGASSYHVKPQNHEELQNLLKVINAYWMTCQVPEIDSTGKQLLTDSLGKLGERFGQDEDGAGSKPERQ